MFKLFSQNSGRMEAVFQSIESCQDVSIFDVGFGTKAWITASISKPTIFVCEGYENQNKLKKQLECFNKKVEIIFSLDYDAKPIKFKDDENIKSLLNCLCLLSQNKLDVLIISPKVLMQRLPSVKQYKENIVEIKVNKSYNFKSIVNMLLKLNYQKTDLVEKQGQFAVRGDIIDVFSVGEKLPFRIDFFGDEVDSLSVINLDNYSKVDSFESVKIYPNTICFIENESYLFNSLDESLKNVSRKLETDTLMRLKTNIEEIKFRVHNSSVNGLENFLIPYLNYDYSILNFAGLDNIVIYDDVKFIVDKINTLYSEFEENFKLSIASGDCFEIHKSLVIEKNKAFLSNGQKLSFQNINTSNRIFTPQKVFTFRPSNVTRFYGKYEELYEELTYYMEFGYTVVVCAKNDATVVHLNNFLTSKKLTPVLTNSLDNIKLNQINLLSKEILYGSIFVEDKIAIIGTEELLGKQQIVSTQKKTKREVFTLPKIGDFVVHEKYGIGKCVGIERRKFASFEKDYIALEYAGGDVLYLPTEQIDSIASYVGSTNKQKLSKLGTQEFLKIKEKVKSGAKEMAFSLLKLYAKRESTKGFKYSQDNDLVKQFENDFAYDETQDQLDAISQIKSDMENGKLMDRLICGDVGYGKTEVALRAIFKAVQDNKQVAFLAPTTILSQQHYNTCVSRMHDYFVNVAVLNRFKTSSEQKKILADLKDGKIDVIVGTHRLLSKDVVFKDLGLLVLDEEQRFGVQDKEKIKNIKSNVDVLTLSATPIPRTLHMSLSGIRDISLITTAPEGRIPVQTVVTEYSDSLLVEAIKKELSRDGQIIIVFNSVEHIYALAERVRMLVGNSVSIDVAHGQMDEKTLENAIFRLYNGETKIFISTTLIENGIDLPNCNTLIVLEADKLGLSQLYQLRGRVGRGNKLGYAYFTYSKEKVMTEDAYKRLNALMEFTELGSGFKIAMRDLEIRGCGNIMGKEQHGHMDKVGYDMYCKLLNEAIMEIKGEKVEKPKEAKIEVSINAYIPKDYIEDSDSRFRVYNQLIGIKTEQSRVEIIKNISQTYGKIVPVEVENLSKISLMRNLAEQYNISRVVINNNKTNLEFYDKQSLLNEKISKNLSVCGLDYVLNFASLPTICFNNENLSCYKMFERILNFLLTCQNSK